MQRKFQRAVEERPSLHACMHIEERTDYAGLLWVVSAYHGRSDSHEELSRGDSVSGGRAGCLTMRRGLDYEKVRKKQLQLFALS